MRERKKDGQAGWFPMNGIIIWRDFALNVKRFASQLVTMKQSRNPKEFSVENYLVYIPKERASITDPVKFSVHCFYVLGEEGKHDTYTAAVNIRKVLEQLEHKKLWAGDGSLRRIFLQSDGCGKEYKSANSMALLKTLAQDFNLQIQMDFFATGNGKGLVDGVSGVFRRQYHSAGVKELKSDARFCNKIAMWIEKYFHEFKYTTKCSRLKVSLVLFKVNLGLPIDIQNGKLLVFLSNTGVWEAPPPCEAEKKFQKKSDFFKSYNSLTRIPLRQRRNLLRLFHP